MRRHLLPLLLLLLLPLAACGDNLASQDADPGGDDAPTVDADPSAARAVVVAGDFATTGILSTLDLPEMQVEQGAIDGVAGTDPFLRRAGDRLHVINRLGGDNITILDAADITLVAQISTGAGSNPQDVAVVGNKLYVPALGTTGVVVIDRANSDARTTIAIAGIDPDGMPDCVSAYAVDTRVFVACGRLDANFTPRGPGVVAVIDTANDTVVDTFDLPARNPTGMFARTPSTSIFGGDLVIGLVPDYVDFSTGCLARVSVGATPAANGCAATNAAMEGYANHVEASPDGLLLWIAVNGFDSSFNAFGNLQGIDLEDGALWPWKVSPDNQVIVDLATCPDGVVVASDRAMGSSGLRVYKNSELMTPAPMDIGLPPSFGNNIVCYPR